jgi:hypothetical protein
MFLSDPKFYETKSGKILMWILIFLVIIGLVMNIIIWLKNMLN